MLFVRSRNALLLLSLAGIASGALQKLLIIIRHGDRTTDNPLVPTDPNINSGSFYVNGKGNITDVGRMQGYELGKRLRNMYQTFMTNDTKEVFAQSSSYPRNIITTGCVLTGLYAPENNLTCMNGSAESHDWPVQVHFPSRDKDYMLSQSATCPNLDKQKEEFKTSSKAREYFEKNEDDIEELASVTGYNNITDYNTVYDIYDNIVVEKAHDLNLSSWVLLMWPTIQSLTFEEIGTLEFQTFASLRLAAGLLMNEIIKRIYVSEVDLEMDNSTMLQNDTYTEFTYGDDAKIFIYGTHDSIMEALMIALDIFNGLNPPYASAIVIELHDNDTVRFMYINSTDPAVNLALPQCQDSMYCPVLTLVNISKPFIVSNPLEECGIGPTSASTDTRVTWSLIAVLQLFALLQLFSFNFLH